MLIFLNFGYALQLINKRKKDLTIQILCFTGTYGLALMVHDNPNIKPINIGIKRFMPIPHHANCLDRFFVNNPTTPKKTPRKGKGNRNKSGISIVSINSPMFNTAREINPMIKEINPVNVCSFLFLFFFISNSII